MISLRLARRNKGVMEPEFRLWLFALAMIIGPAGLILWGVGYAHGIQWVGLLFGMAFSGLVSGLAGSLCVTYVVDCYRELGGEALITMVLIRNTLNFAFNYGVTPWLDHNGAQNMFITAAMMCLVTTALFFVMIKWGKQMRASSAATYWNYVATKVVH